MSIYKYYKNHVVITCGVDDYRVGDRRRGKVLPGRFTSRATALSYIDQLVEQATNA